MKNNPKNFRLKKERVVLSDIHPYEIPLIFSNRHLYNFIIKYKFKIEKNKIMWISDNDNTIKDIVTLLFNGENGSFDSSDEILNSTPKILQTQPYSYRIAHRTNDYRELYLIHPVNNLEVIDFYDIFKDLIIYYNNISPFSIRRPIKVSNTDLYNILKKNLQPNESVKDYANLKSYFVYKDYSNIYKFYESNKYQRCEKKFNDLLLFDISKCFDSIYTHSITWALLNKHIVKANLTNPKTNFGDKFDLLMQHVNYNETHGIVIGPEFSRLFAELILQKIDVLVLEELKSEKLVHKVDFEIFRYIDDYFVFYNDKHNCEMILQAYRRNLKEYKLFLNESKTNYISKPIITGITIAKHKINNLLNNNLIFQLASINPQNSPSHDVEDDIEVGINCESPEKQIPKRFDTNKLIVEFKTIIRDSSVTYGDILNYTLVAIERKLKSLICQYNKLEEDVVNENLYARIVFYILEFSFFLYSMNPGATTTIKLSMILRRIIKNFSDKQLLKIENKHFIYKLIWDNIFLTLSKYKSQKHTQIETLFLLIILSELGKEYVLSEDTLIKHIGITIDKNKKLHFSGDLSYFTLVVLLYYVKHDKLFKKLRCFLVKHILHRLTKISPQEALKQSELVHLLFDSMTCPYINITSKKKILTHYGIVGDQRQKAFIKKRKYWFIKWTKFDFGNELDTKRSKEVY